MPRIYYYVQLSASSANSQTVHPRPKPHWVEGVTGSQKSTFGFLNVGRGFILSPAPLEVILSLVRISHWSSLVRGELASAASCSTVDRTPD